jgi:hypothetical protein
VRRRFHRHREGNPASGGLQLEAVGPRVDLLSS